MALLKLLFDCSDRCKPERLEFLRILVGRSVLFWPQLSGVV